jgi:hypothetical protein
MRNALAALAVITLAAHTLAAAPPTLTHGRAEALGGGGPLQSRVESVNGWVGWSVPAQDARQISCCDNWYGGGNCTSCRLDGENMNISSNDRDGLHVAVDHYNLFARVSDHRIDRIRLFSANCTLDASGNTVYWMDDVRPADSIALLRSLVAGGSDKGRDNALMVLAFHEGGTDALIDAARHGTHETRGKALFWLSQQAGEKATATLKDAVENDPDDDVRGKAVFGISQLPDDRSIPLLIELTTHRSRAVRKKAIFWLGQKNDPRALAAIEDILKR